MTEYNCYKVVRSNLSSLYFGRYYSQEINRVLPILYSKINYVSAHVGKIFAFKDLTCAKIFMKALDRESEKEDGIIALYTADATIYDHNPLLCCGDFYLDSIRNFWNLYCGENRQLLIDDFLGKNGKMKYSLSQVAYGTIYCNTIKLIEKIA